MKKGLKLGWVLLFVLIVLTGCQGKNDEMNELKDQLKINEEKVMILEKKLQSYEEDENIHKNPVNGVKFAVNALEDIKAGDMASLSDHVHPEKGLRFSPYFNIDTKNDLVFTAQQVAELMQNSEVFHWGSYDGTGKPIDLTFKNYYSVFVYDHDFMNADLIGNNHPIGSGNAVDNIKEAYPESDFVEFHFTGFDSEFEGIDWSSLRLVFEKEEGEWYLVGIVHGQWTV